MRIWDGAVAVVERPCLEAFHFLVDVEFVAKVTDQLFKVRKICGPHRIASAKEAAECRVQGDYVHHWRARVVEIFIAHMISFRSVK